MIDIPVENTGNEKYWGFDLQELTTIIGSSDNVRNQPNEENNIWTIK